MNFRLGRSIPSCFVIGVSAPTPSNPAPPPPSPRLPLLSLPPFPRPCPFFCVSCTTYIRRPRPPSTVHPWRLIPAVHSTGLSCCPDGLPNRSRDGPGPLLRACMPGWTIEQAFIPVAQGALSRGSLQVVRPVLELAAARLLHALATTGAPTVLRNARRFCRALVQVRDQKSCRDAPRGGDGEGAEDIGG